MTLNRMYHCVPRIISRLSQISGLSRNLRISTTAAGKNKFAGNAARNCTIGCALSARRGMQADPHPDRHPEKRGQHDQHEDPDRRDEAKDEHPPDLGDGHAGADEQKNPQPCRRAASARQHEIEVRARTAADVPGRVRLTGSPARHRAQGAVDGAAGRPRDQQHEVEDAGALQNESETRGGHNHRRADWSPANLRDHARSGRNSSWS